MFHAMGRSLKLALSSLALAMLLVATTPLTSHATPRRASQTLSIPKHNLNKAMKEACLPGGLFDGFANIVDIFDDINAMLSSLDQFLNSVLKGFNPGFNPLACLPEFDPTQWFNFNPDWLNQCIQSLPIPQCSFPNNFDPRAAFEDCLEGVGQINLPPGVNLDQIAACAVPDAQMPTLPDIMGMLSTILDQLRGQLLDLTGILNARNIKLLDWFVNFCGEVNRGNIKIKTERVRTKASRRR